jgi:hypothetical protein
MLIVLLIAYSVGVSYYLIRGKRTQDKPDDMQKFWQNLTAKANPSVDEIKAIAEVAKVRQTGIPWYERGVSTIGIVAFFSMLLATSFQTINSAKAEIESSNLKQEISSLEAQRNSWNKLVRDLSEVIVLKAADGKLERSEEAVLKQRLNEIEKVDKPDKEEEAEKLKIYLALKQYDNASELVGKSKVLADETNPESLIFLAEMSFVDGARARARVLLKKFEDGLSKQPPEWQLRYYVLNAALGSDPKLFGNEVAALRHTSLDDANQWLEAKVEELKSQAKRRSVALENSGSGAQTTEPR